MKITLALVNHSTVKTAQLGFDPNNLAALAKALQEYVMNCVEPAWRLGIFTTFVVCPPDEIPNGAWVIGFFDDADAARALGYHQYINNLPLAKVFVKTCIANNSSISVCASHEVVEMVCDPDASHEVLWTSTGKPPKKFYYAMEPADPVEETSFKVQGFDMSNFVFPAWFRTRGFYAGYQLDYLKLVKKPLTLLSGGYIPVRLDGGVWIELFGSKEKEARWKKEDRRGHRNEELRKK